IYGSSVGELFIEMKMKMADQHLVARERFVDVVVREGHYGLLGGATVLRAEVEVHRHTLFGTRGRVVESEVIEVAARFADATGPPLVGDAPRLRAYLTIRLPRADRERTIAVFPVINVTEIGFDFPRPEKLMRRRKESERSAVGLEDRETVAGSQGNGLLIDRASEDVLLPCPGSVAPHHSRVVGEGEAFQSCNIFVSHRRFVGLGDGFLPKEIGPAIDRVLERAGENATVETGENDLDARSVGLHPAPGYVVFSPGSADLF